MTRFSFLFFFLILSTPLKVDWNCFFFFFSGICLGLPFLYSGFFFITISGVHTSLPSDGVWDSEDIQKHTFTQRSV